MKEMAKERLLITGGSGFLGGNIAKMTAKSFDVFATYNSHPNRIGECRFLPLDIRDKTQVVSVFNKIKPDLVIHTAGLVDVDYCESHPEEAVGVNVDGTRNVVMGTQGVGAKMIYISTDSVFDGKKGMYIEEDTPNPISVYAKTKLEGEKIVQQWLPSSIIIRTAFYGWHLINTSNLSLAEWIVNGLRGKRYLKMFTDVYFTPIFTNGLVKALVGMYRKEFSGIYHVGGGKRCSKFAFGQEIARTFGIDECYIQPSSIDDVGLGAPRPYDASLDNTKISQALNANLFDFQKGIVQFRDTEKSFEEDKSYLL